MQFHLVATGDKFRYNVGTIANPEWVTCLAYVSDGRLSVSFDRVTSRGFETVFSKESYDFCVGNGWIVWDAVPVRPPVALDNTPYTKLRNWRTRPLPLCNELNTVANLLEGIAMDLIDCDDPDSISSLQGVCDDLDKLYNLPGDAGLEGVE